MAGAPLSQRLPSAPTLGFLSSRPHVIGRRASLAAIGAVLLAGRAAFAAETAPSVIRIAGQGAGYGKPFGLQVIGVLQAGRFVENALPGVRVEWQFPDGTGPAINEALANGQLDFANYGGLPNIIGRAGGLPTRILASYGSSNVYVAVRTAVRARAIAELRGLRVAVARGTIVHLSMNRLLAENGLSERDVQLFDLKAPDQITALTGGDVDAAFGSPSFLALRDQGIVRILYTTRGKITPANYFGSFVVTEDFAHRYPRATDGVVRAFVAAAHWASEEAHRAQVLAIWERSGTPTKALIEDSAALPLAARNDPLIDDFFVSQLKSGVDFALRNKLIRQSVDVDAWIDRGALDAALTSLKLHTYWRPRPAQWTS
jgi:sulfonate transport system substrate-binding protein